MATKGQKFKIKSWKVEAYLLKENKQQFLSEFTSKSKAEILEKTAWYSEQGWYCKITEI